METFVWLERQFIEFFSRNDSLFINLGALSVLVFLTMAWKSFEWMRSEGHFDGVLWKRLMELIQQNRTKDAVELCRVEQGAMARILLAGMEEYDVNKENASYCMLMKREAALAPLRRETLMTGALTLLIPLVGMVGALMHLGLGNGLLAHLLTSLEAGEMQAAMMYPLVGFFGALPVAVLFVYNLMGLHRLMRRSTQCIGQLLTALSERPTPVPPAQRRPWAIVVNVKDEPVFPELQDKPVPPPPVPVEAVSSGRGAYTWEDVSRFS